jgi:hypothetical protein
MNIVKHEIEKINSQTNMECRKSITAAGDIRGFKRCPDEEDSMNSWVKMVSIAAALAAAVVVVASGLYGTAARGPRALGRMPEVAVVAEMPRLVTDTVYVDGFRNMASSDAVLPVN